MDRISISPGRLYARLGEEFRRLRPSECACCQMPMVIVIEQTGDDGANWLVDEMPRGCPECRAVVSDIVQRHSSSYDIFDPTVIPVCTNPMPEQDFH